MSYTIGLRDLHFAPFAQDPSTGLYLPPVKIKDAITATVTPNFTITTLYADDRAVAVAQALGDIDIALTVGDLGSAEYDLIMGTQKNEDGVIVDNIDDVAPYGALLFRLPFDTGGFRYYCYYKGRFQPPGTESNTKGSSVEYQNPTINGKFVALDNGNWRAHHETPQVLTSVAQNWFKSVYMPTEGGVTPEPPEESSNEDESI